jgi:hypothetical protein
MLHIKVIDGWATEVDGRSKSLGPSEEAVLQALVLGKTGIFGDQLGELLPEPNNGRKHVPEAVRNTLDKLRKTYNLDIKTNASRVRMPRRQPEATVDLWEFLALVDLKRYAEAYRMVEHGAKLYRPEKDVRDEDLWSEVDQRFEAAKEKVFAAVSTQSTRAQKMREVRAKHLSRPLAPGFEPSAPIATLRERLELLPFTWHADRTPQPPRDCPLPEYLSETLEQASAPSQIFVIGAPGSGKALTAISVYLRLTDYLDGDGDAQARRIVLFVNARREDPSTLATDSWLAQRLTDAGAQEHERPIIIVAHADAFFAANVSKLDEVFGYRMFRECDLLLCCNEQFHAKILSYHDYGTHEIKLTDWESNVQNLYALALYDQDTCDRFEAWRDEFASRGELCKVPLHLHYVLPLFNRDEQPLERIEQRWQLFECVAKMRMAATRHRPDEDALLDDLASVAHKFYVAGTPTDRPIRFTEEQLRRHLQQHGVENIESRSQILIEHTLLTASVHGPGQLRFENLLWGWFFTAYHLCRTLVKGGQRPDVVKAFGKPFSAVVMDRCAEILRGWLEHEESIIPTLRDALLLPKNGSVPSGPSRIARAQVAYLLGSLAEGSVRVELEAVVLRDDPRWENDDVVRRGIAIGLADGGATEVASAYVDALREELQSGGPTPQGDTNIGCVLSFHGDQPFSPDQPGLIAGDPDPIHSVADLVQGLERTRHRGTWRIKLFTLVDLAARVGPDHFRECVIDHEERLTKVLDGLERKVHTSSWPEVAELRSILEGLPVAAN